MQQEEKPQTIMDFQKTLPDKSKEELLDILSDIVDEPERFVEHVGVIPASDFLEALLSEVQSKTGARPRLPFARDLRRNAALLRRRAARKPN